MYGLQSVWNFPTGVLLLVAILAVVVAQAQPVVEVTEVDGVSIRHCHRGDYALMQINPVNFTPVDSGVAVHLRERLLTTTNERFFLRDFTMAQPGTNVLLIWTVCGGMTSAPVVVTVWVKRTPPAPRIGRAMVPMTGPYPPLPVGMIMPLPGGTNVPYVPIRTHR